MTGFTNKKKNREAPERFKIKLKSPQNKIEIQIVIAAIDPF